MLLLQYNTIHYDCPVRHQVARVTMQMCLRIVGHNAINVVDWEKKEISVDSMLTQSIFYIKNGKMFSTFAEEAFYSIYVPEEYHIHRHNL